MKLVLRVLTFVIFAFKYALEGQHGAHTSNPALGRQKQKDQSLRPSWYTNVFQDSKGYTVRPPSNNEQTNLSMLGSMHVRDICVSLSFYWFLYTLSS